MSASGPLDVLSVGSDAPEIEKLIEYRTGHYAADSEAASYFSNHPAQVQFCFSNPIIWQLRSGHKSVRVDGGAPIDVQAGDAMYVPPGAQLDIDLATASPLSPTECYCVEIDTSRFVGVVSSLNERWASTGRRLSANVDWSRHATLRGSEARDLELVELMGAFRGERDVFSEMQIDLRIDATVLRLLQLRTAELLHMETDHYDGELAAAVRAIRDRLHERISTADLAADACMSESTFFRRFRQQFGTTPARFAMRIRVSEAKSALRHTEESIDALAFRLGFADASHFARVFRKATGETPSGYRDRRESTCPPTD